MAAFLFVCRARRKGGAPFPDQLVKLAIPHTTCRPCRGAESRSRRRGAERRVNLTRAAIHCSPVHACADRRSPRRSSSRSALERRAVPAPGPAHGHRGKRPVGHGAADRRHRADGFCDHDRRRPDAGRGACGVAVPAQAVAVADLAPPGACRPLANGRALGRNGRPGAAARRRAHPVSQHARIPFRSVAWRCRLLVDRRLALRPGGRGLDGRPAAAAAAG